MNIDAKFFGIIIFVIAQTGGAIWWASSLSSEVNRLSALVDKSDQMVSGLDLLNFKVEEVWKAIDKLEKVDTDIMIQHEAIFEALAEDSSRNNPYE
tara:strand:- start:165 stop:452 length:288 start_codon:yes stop_codon:yes gene_type:complete